VSANPATVVDTPVLTAKVPSVTPTSETDTLVTTVSSVHVPSLDSNIKSFFSSCAEPYGPDRDLLSHMNSIDRDFKGDIFNTVSAELQIYVNKLKCDDIYIYIYI
jgi:hypothetical protein